MRGLSDLSGPNTAYLVEEYERFRREPSSVMPELRELFVRWTPPDIASARPRQRADAPAHPDVHALLKAAALARVVRARGHEAADLDPLGLAQRDLEAFSPPAFDLSQAELASLPASAIGGPAAEEAQDALTAWERLRAVYCGTTGYQFESVSDAEEQAWLRDAVESGKHTVSLDAGGKRRTLERLTQVEAFEQFLHRSFPGQKWFSLEGNDTLIPLLDEMLSQMAGAGVKTAVIGMPHRGRLNVLAHVMRKPYEAILAEFTGGRFEGEDGCECPDQGMMRDVKYHEGADTTLDGSGHTLAVHLLPNPSHLELIDAVTPGAVRAIQERSGPSKGAPAADADSAVAIVMHGDAAFAAQGVVAEMFNLARLLGYTVGGTLHVVVNNQIGFTTGPEQARSTRYATDLARGYGVPVVHVNGDDVEAVLSAGRLAFEYRRRFHKDFVIDLIGYRRFGHNEGDEPAFTQPVMYERVRAFPTARTRWATRLAEEGTVSAAEAEAMARDAAARLSQAMAAVTRAESPREDAASAPLDVGERLDIDTSVPEATLRRLSEELRRLPEGFSLHPKLGRMFERQGSGGKVDWGQAEALAFATLLSEGVPVRLSGQDTERGTFSQRHAALTDYRTGRRFVPLQALPSARATFGVYNSPLSEVAALGFEYGYASQAGETLVLWEAQYGDFANNAQAMIDEFIASGGAKWCLCSGLVLLLPHGYEGQGPDHSNAHLARFLSLAAGDNIQVAYPTTAAQYFHLLRRQALSLSESPKPLVVMSPKGLLRHPLAAATLSVLANGQFRPVIDEGRARPEDVERVVVCSGKVYADLVSNKAYADARGVAIVRVEMLAPFPARELSEALARYPHAQEVAWVQEEPANFGAWAFVAPRLRAVLKPGVSLEYVGRPEMPSPAEGTMAQHREAQERLVQEALSYRGREPAAARGVSNAR